MILSQLGPNLQPCHRVRAKVGDPGVCTLEAWVHIADDNAISVAEIVDRRRSIFSCKPTFRGQEKDVTAWASSRKRPAARSAVEETLGGRYDVLNHPYPETCGAHAVDHTGILRRQLPDARRLN